MTNDDDVDNNFEDVLLMKNKSYPTLEKREHHYIPQFPNQSEID